MLQLCLQGERGHLWEVGAACSVLPYDSAHRWVSESHPCPTRSVSDSEERKF